MSTNAVDNRRSAPKRYTVAELIAREGAANRPHRPAYQPAETATMLSVAELLRREGIEFAGEDSPTVELKSVSAPVHVAELLRRASAIDAMDTLHPDGDKPRSKRATAVGGAAALAGLTLAGLIALKPQLAFTPGGESPGTGGDGGVNSTAALQPGGGAQPTTTLARATTVSSSSERAIAAAANGAGSGGNTGGHDPDPDPEPDQPVQVPVSTTTTTAPAPTTTQTPPPPPEETKPTPPEDDDSGDDGILDPILDPVTGVITGTLDGLG